MSERTEQTPDKPAAGQKYFSSPDLSKKFSETYRIQGVNRLREFNIYPYFMAIHGKIGPRTVMNGRETIMLGSNNYMGLTNHPDLIRAGMEAIQKYGTGCTGSRFLSGTLDIHNALEGKLAKFFGKKEAICFSTGMQANLGVISAVAEKGDHIVSDEKNHASIIDGCRLSYAETHVYKHNNMKNLRRVLSALPQSGNRWIISDGVFSMEGTVADIPAIVELAGEFGARVIIDDAHGIGYLGDHGEGCCGHFNIMDKIDILTGTFSKSFASLGGFCAASKDIIDYIRHHARSLIFSASMPPAMVACASKAIDIFYSEKSLRNSVTDNALYLSAGIENAGFKTIPHSLPIPIIPIVVGDIGKMFRFNKALCDAGVYTNPVLPPASDEAMLRLSVMANHTEDDLAEALDILCKVGKQMDLI